MLQIRKANTLFFEPKFFLDLVPESNLLDPIEIFIYFFNQSKIAAFVNT